MTIAAVAILTWRDEAATRACLTSLMRAGGWTGPVVVVDNGSGTGEGQRLAKEFGVEAIELNTNGGVPAGYNAALRWAIERDIGAITLANNDIEFIDGSLPTRLAELIGPGVCAAGPLVRRGDGSVASAGVRMHRWLGHAERLRSPLAAEPYVVDALDGSCWAVSISAVCAIGGLAEDFFLYWEETDWCARARQAGLRVVVDPSLAATHEGSRTATLRLRRAYALRNSLLYVRRNARGFSMFTAAMAWLLGRLPLFVVRRLREGAGVASVLADLGSAVSFHARDIAQRGWRHGTGGPNLCA